MSNRIKVLAYKNPLNEVLILPSVRFLDRNVSRRLVEMYSIIGCKNVDFTQVKVAGKYYDIWCDDEALLVDNPRPILYINKDYVIFGNGIIFSKSNDEGEMVSLNDNDIWTLIEYFNKQYSKLEKILAGKINVKEIFRWTGIM